MKLSEIERVLKSCQICYNGAVFSEEVIIRKFSHFIANSISFEQDRKKKREKKKRAVILHTGSDCFDALLLVYLSFMCILDNPYDLEAYISEIQNGELVWYGDTKPSRHRFLKRNGDYIELEQQNSGDPTKRSVPRSKWHKIRKYNGNSQTADTRGSRYCNEKQAEDLMQSVFGKHFTPVLLSAVVCCPRLRAEELMRSISIQYLSKKTKKPETLSLLDLVTASYYTAEDNCYPIGSNPAQTEAVLQFVADLTLTKRMLSSGSVTENNKIGMLIMVQDRKAEVTTGMENLINFGNRTFSILSASIAGADLQGILDRFQALDEDTQGDQQFEDRYFICSKDYLISGHDLQNVFEPVIPNPVTQTLCTQIDRLIDAEIDVRVVESPFDVEFCSVLHDEIFAVRKYELSEEEEENKEQFVINAFSLLKLFLNAVFPLRALAETAERFDKPMTDCSAMITEMQNSMGRFPGQLFEIAFDIISRLEKMQQYCTDEYGKGVLLEELLEERRDKRIALIVPKKRYISVLHCIGSFDLMENAADLHVLTPGQFTNLEHYDTVIAVGTSVLTGRFNIFQCPNTNEQIILLHPYEEMLYNRRRRERDLLMNQINRRSTFPIDLEACLPVTASAELESQVEKAEEQSIQIDEYIEKLRMEYSLHQIRSSAGTESRLAEAIMLIRLDSGEMMYLSEHCKLYVFDESSEKEPIREVKPPDLRKGDLLLVTADYEETRDIVELIHKQRLTSGALSEAEVQDYQMAMRWKTDLREYKEAHQLTNADVARELCARYQLKKDPATINGWLDPNSHTVRPRHDEDLLQIASLCNDEEMFNHYTAYFEAGRKVLQIRKKIRKEIGIAIREQLGGTTSGNQATQELSELISDYSELVTIEEICKLHPAEPVAYSMINRPIY